MNISARRSRSKLVVAVAAAALVGGSLPVFLISSLSPRISADLGLGEAALGTVVAAFFLAGAASSVPGGRTADRLGAAASLRIGLTISAVAGLGVVLLAAGPWSLAACLFLAGTSLGFIDTGGARAIAATIPLTRQGLAFGGKEASIPAASLLAGIAVPLLGAAAGWRAAFVAAIGYAVLLAIAVPRDLDALPTARQLLGAGGAVTPGTAPGSPGSTSPDRVTAGAQPDLDAMPDGASDVAGSLPAPGHDAAPDALPANKPDAPPDTTSASEPDTTSSAGSRAAGQSPAPAARRWPLVALAVSAALGGGAAASAATFLVPSAVAGGLSADAAGMLLAGASVAGILSRLSVGAVADRRIGGELRIVAVLLGLGAIGVLGLASGLGAVIVPGAALAIGGGWGWTGLVFLAAVRLDPARPAKAAGTVLAGLGVGGASGPAVFGWLAGGPGFELAWVVAAGAFLLALGFTSLADVLRRRPAVRATAH